MLLTTATQAIINNFSKFELYTHTHTYKQYYIIVSCIHTRLSFLISFFVLSWSWIHWKTQYNKLISLMFFNICLRVVLHLEKEFWNACKEKKKNWSLFYSLHSSSSYPFTYLFIIPLWIVNWITTTSIKWYDNDECECNSCHCHSSLASLVLLGLCNISSDFTTYNTKWDYKTTTE